MLDRYGMPPFAKLVSANPHESVRRNFGNTRWLTLHMAGNGERYHNSYDEWVGDDFRSEPPKPALNGEPHYAGWYDVRGGPIGGTPEDDLDIRSSMYGNVLCGGLAGHIYGASGLWGGDVEHYAKYMMWDGIKWQLRRAARARARLRPLDRPRLPRPRPAPRAGLAERDRAGAELPRLGVRRANRRPPSLPAVLRARV